LADDPLIKIYEPEWGGMRNERAATTNLSLCTKSSIQSRDLWLENLLVFSSSSSPLHSAPPTDIPHSYHHHHQDYCLTQRRPLHSFSCPNRDPFLSPQSSHRPTPGSFISGMFQARHLPCNCPSTSVGKSSLRANDDVNPI